MNLAFTIATSDYLSQAITVGYSYVEHNPEDKFVIYLFDKIQGRFDSSQFLPLEIIEVDTSQIENFDEMLIKYNLFELLTAIKPSISLMALNQFKEYDCYIFLDSDMLVYNNFSEVNMIIDTGIEIIISSHFFSLIPVDGNYPDDKTYFNCGIYNAGFYVFTQGRNAVAFLNWWQERLKTECLLDFSRGLFYEQVWLNLVPIYFENVSIIKHPGFNVGYWNFHERALTVAENSELRINEDYPLVFFHFSGYDIRSPDILSKFQNRYSFENKPNMKQLFDNYRDLLIANETNQLSGLKCYYKPLVRQPIKRSFIQKAKSKVGRLFIE